MSGNQTPSTFTKRQRVALRLLARGGARYGTEYEAMTELRDMGLAYAHDTGKPPPGRWTWRPTAAGLAAQSALTALRAGGSQR